MIGDQIIWFREFFGDRSGPVRLWADWETTLQLRLNRGRDKIWRMPKCRLTKAIDQINQYVAVNDVKIRALGAIAHDRENKLFPILRKARHRSGVGVMTTVARRVRF